MGRYGINCVCLYRIATLTALGAEGRSRRHVLCSTYRKSERFQRDDLGTGRVLTFVSARSSDNLGSLRFEFTRNVIK
jgi:hypothetical protein